MKGIKLRLEVLEECEKKTKGQEEGGERERERDLPSAFFIVDRCNSSSGSVWLCSWVCFFAA